MEIHGRCIGVRRVAYATVGVIHTEILDFMSDALKILSELEHICFRTSVRMQELVNQQNIHSIPSTGASGLTTRTPVSSSISPDVVLSVFDITSCSSSSSRLIMNSSPVVFSASCCPTNKDEKYKAKIPIANTRIMTIMPRILLSESFMKSDFSKIQPFRSSVPVHIHHNDFRIIVDPGDIAFPTKSAAHDHDTTTFYCLHTLIQLWEEPLIG